MPKIVHPPVRITDSTVKRLSYVPERLGIYRCDRTPGFYVQVQPSGRASFKYRTTQTSTQKTINVLIGRVGEISVDEARAKAVKALQEIRTGSDPRRKKAATLGEIYKINDSRLMKERRSLIHRENVLANGKRHLDDWLDRDVSTITVEELEERYNKIAITDQTPGAARNVFRELSAAWRYCYQRDRKKMPECPIPNRGFFLKPDTEAERAKREARPIPVAELPAWWQSCTTLPDELRSLAHRFQLLGGLRPNNAWRLAWAWVDIDGRRVDYPSTAMKGRKPFTLPLSGPMVAILERAKAVKPEGPLVFLAEPGAPRSQPWTEWGGPLVGLVGHRLRHTAKNIYRAAGIDFEFRQRLSAHSIKGIEETYTAPEMLFNSLLEAQETISAHILKACKG